MRMWKFASYVIIEESDLLRFEDYEGNILGYVTKNGFEELYALDNGADPIAERWEDGNGNTVTLDGWGFVAEKEG